ncbi:unnamed protein product [Effrenium voratum]|nr:unnamed protein product [Effrenium voratum]
MVGSDGMNFGNGIAHPKRLQVHNKLQPGDSRDPKEVTVYLGQLARGGPRAVLQALESLVLVRAEVNVIHENVVLGACIQKRDWQLAIHRLRAMKARPNLVSCNSAMSASSWHHALQLLHAARATFLQPSTTSYNALVTLAGVALWPTAAQLLEEMRRQQVRLDVKSFFRPGTWSRSLGQLLKMSASSLQPDAISFGSAGGLCGAGAWLMGSHLLRDMGVRQLKINKIHFAALMRDPGAAGSWQLCFTCLRTMAASLVQHDKQSLSVLGTELCSCNVLSLAFVLCS